MKVKQLERKIAKRQRKLDKSKAKLAKIKKPTQDGKVTAAA